MSKKARQIDFRQLYEFIGPLNMNESLFLAIERKQGEKQEDSKRVIIKKIDFGQNFGQMKQVHDNILRKLYTNNQPMILKPQYFCFQEGCLYISQKIHTMSLQTMIKAHRKERGPFNGEIVWSFACKMYDTINRMKQTQFFHQNLKPSNIFMQYAQSEIKWYLSESGLHTNNRNKYYSKIDMQNSVNLNKIDPIQFQFYALGVMILQMTTLTQIQKIDVYARQKNGVSKIQGIDDAMRNYGSLLIQFAKQLLNPKQNLKDYFHKFRQQPARKITSQPSIDQYYRQSDHFYQFCKQRRIIHFEEEIKKNFINQSLHFRQILDYIKKIDINLDFVVDGFQEFQAIFTHYRIKFNSIAELVSICTYYTQLSKLRYMDIFIRIVPSKQIVEAVIRQAILRGEGTCKGFFQSLPKIRDDVWKAQEIVDFLKSLGINIGFTSITEIIRDWTMDKMKDAIKFKEFYQIFKAAANQKSVLIEQQNASHVKSGLKMNIQKEVIRVLKQVQKKCGKNNLVSFFRTFDNKEKWVVGSTIQKQMRQYITINQKDFKNICDQMWNRGGLPGQMTSKQLRYVFLLKMLDYYDKTQLMRMVLAQKINQSNKNALFDEYSKDDKGWSVYSLIDFNHNQMLEFDETQIRLIFNELDRDRSGYISKAELVYKITGLRQFDQDFLISQISEIKKNSRNRSLMDVFIDVDRNKDLLLDSTDQLRNFFQEIGVQVPPNHCQKLFMKFQRSEQFQYLVFLRFFYNLWEVFYMACHFVIKRYFKGDFDKFYQIGLKSNKKKWNRESVGKINDQLFHCFSDNQIGNIWQQMDKNNDGSLTKKQIALLYGFKLEDDDQMDNNPIIKTKYQGSKNYKQPERQIEGSKKKSYNKALQEKKQSFKDKIRDQIQKNQVLRIFKDLKQQAILEQFYQVSHQSGWVELNKFQDIALKMGVRASKNTINKCAQKFISTNERDRQEKVNYVKMLLFLNQGSQNSPEEKCRTILQLLKKAKQNRKLTTQQLFKKCKSRDKMVLNDFDKLFRDLFDFEIYFEDIEDTWSQIGDPEYLTIQDLDRILASNFKKTIMKKEFSFRDQQKNRDYEDKKEFRHSKSKKNQQQSPYLKFESRKQSDDSLQSDTHRLSQQDKSGRKHHQKHYEREKYKDQYNKKYQYQKRQENNKYSNNRQYSSKKLEKQQRDRQSFKKRQVQERNRQYDYKNSKINKKDSSEDDKYHKRESYKYKNDDQHLKRPSQRLQKFNYQQDEKSKLKKQNKNYGYDYQQNKQSKRNEPHQKRSLYDKYDRGSQRDQNKYQSKYNQKRGRQTQKQQQKRKQLSSKKDLEIQNYIKLFEERIFQKGIDKLNELFNRVDLIDNVRFSKCLKQNYDFTQTEANQITQIMSSFGKVRLQTLKKHVKKSAIKKEYHQGRSDKKENWKRKQQTKYVEEAVGEKKIFDSRKSKLNVPLIKQHIKVLINSFKKKYDISELEGFYFEGKNSISRNQFTKKCDEINQSISKPMIDKIFDHLKPKHDDTIQLITFKIAFFYDQNIPVQDEYLPEQIQKELKEIFDKADTDKNGDINIVQIQKLLISLGLNLTKKQIQNYFSRIDRNSDKKITFNQFRMFIQETILPNIIVNQDEIDQLRKNLEINDLYNTGNLNISTLAGVIQRHGVRVNESEINLLARALANQNDEINIKQFLQSIECPFKAQFPGKLRCFLYKIKWRRKVSLKDVKKVFENLSSCFLISSTYEALKNNLIKYSSSLTPQIHESGYFYQDFKYKNIRNISKNQSNLIQQVPLTDLVVQIKIQQACGLPIPQNELKGKIVRRHLNVTFYDMSSQSINTSICSLQCEWDPDIQDQWLFDKSNRSIFIKIANFDLKKQQRNVVLLEFIITIILDNRVMEISCGCASLSLRELHGIQSRLNKRVSIIGGLPSKSRQIDKNSVTKRTGWKSLLNSTIESQIDLQINARSRFQDKIPFIASLPSFAIVNRKIIHYIWAFRQYFAQKSLDGDRVNPNYQNNYKVKVFLLTFDIPSIYLNIVKNWKDKIQLNIKDIKIMIEAMKVFLEQIYQIIYCKQFDYKPALTYQNVIGNKALHDIRSRLVQDVFDNIQYWLKDNPNKNYIRRKNYSTEFVPFKIHEKQITPQDMAILKTIYKFAVK